jgi:hypothetical protein
MAFALWSRPCSNNGCDIKRQPGCTSTLTRCSRHYVPSRGSDYEKFKPLTSLGYELGRNLSAAVKAVLTWLPLLDARDDYRRVFLVIPWAALVAIYLLLGTPLFLAGSVYLNGCAWVFQLKDAHDVLPFYFSNLYNVDRHHRLRSFVASRSLLAVPMMLLFFIDCCFYFVGSAIGVMIWLPVFPFMTVPILILSNWFIRFREGEINEFQHTCCQCLTQRACKRELGMDFSFEKEACQQCKKRDMKWIWMGCEYSSGLDNGWKRVARETGELLHAPGSMLVDDPNLVAVQLPKHTTVLPQWLLLHCSSSSLQTLNLANCRCLEKLPLADILKFPVLTSLSCEGCSQLWSIPQEICSQGGVTTMRFLREVERAGQINTSVTLFLIGDGEAGKTSIIMSLTSESGRAFHIRTDHRTIGIDISKWAPQGQNVDFTLFDLAGQAVYLQTHQLFLLRRAVYMQVWRPPEGQRKILDLIHGIERWLQCLQNRIPGAFVMLVVTHIDLVDPETLASACAQVKSAVIQIISGMKGCAKEGTPVLSLWGQGESLPVNSLSGQGIPRLRAELIAFAKSMPWYGESLPASWMVLKELLKSREQNEEGMRVPSLSWSEYSRMARNPPCSLSEYGLTAATSFFHDSCVIRYFEAADKDTVYISTSWMMDVIKGLMRHDRQALVDFFTMERNKRMLRHTNRLIRYGLLHMDLVPFLWPEQDDSSAFWMFVKAKGSREADLWSDKIVSTKQEGQDALTLLTGFSLIGKDGGNHLAPGVLPPAVLLCSPALYVKECLFNASFVYAALPAGAFHFIVVSVSKNDGISLDMGSSYAVINKGLNDIAQLFCLRNQPSRTGLCAAFSCLQPRQRAESSDQLIIRSSSKALLEKLKEQVSTMEKQYPGLVRLAQASKSPSQESKDTIKPPVVWVDSRGKHARSQIPCNGLYASGTICNHVFDRSECLEQFNHSRTLLNNSEISQGIIECPRCKATHVLFDLLTHFHIPEQCFCPCCLQHRDGKGRKAGVFNAGECRLKLTQDTNARHAELVTCQACLGAGRLGQIRILDVISPDMFVSGQNAVAGRMQGTVDSLLQSIELDADIIISNRSRESEALSFIEDARIVLVLLSDAYVRSSTCRAEFRAAVRCCLPLVPILMPCTAGGEDGADSSMGWTGPGPDNMQYWRHAADMCRHMPMGAEGTTDWAFLEHFTPLLFAQAQGDLYASLAGLSAEACKLVDARLHRHGRVESYSDFSMLGVRLSFFRYFVDTICGGRGALQGRTTLEVMQRWIFPATESSKLSYCELLASDASEGMRAFVGTATWFYSHAWRYLFLDVVDAAEVFFGQTQEQDPVVWFDVFSVSQHKAGVRPFEWWSSVFLNSIGSIGRVLMAMQPLDDGATQVKAWVTLSRVWCVFELYSCEATLSEFHVTMTAGMAARFRQAMLCEDRAWLTSLASLDCEQSEAVKREDRELVFDAIQRTVGFPLLNSTVLHVMERWLASSFLAGERARGGSDYPQLLQTVVEAVEALQRRRASMSGIAGHHPHSLAAMHTLAALYREQGRLADAQVACAECARVRARVLGREHADTLASERLLAELGTLQGRAPQELRGEASLEVPQFGCVGLPFPPDKIYMPYFPPADLRQQI